jgi:ABC-type dipeptide/oligopeptide/nickel transport system ATPase subunit
MHTTTGSTRLRAGRPRASVIRAPTSSRVSTPFPSSAPPLQHAATASPAATRLHFVSVRLAVVATENPSRANCCQSRRTRFGPSPTAALYAASMTAPAAPRVLGSWKIPCQDGQFVQLDAAAGQVTTVVGANGSGKSALSAWLAQSTDMSIVRIIAHRQIWFPDAGSRLSPAQRHENEAYYDQIERQPDSRYLDHLEDTRTNRVLFDLQARIHEQNQRGMDLLDAGSAADAIRVEVGPLLLNRLNEVFTAAELPIQIVPAASDQLYVHRVTGDDYPIYRLSDGEKNALLLAAQIITCDSDTVVIVDEPERHLHRAVSAGLIEALIDQRPDCHFIAFTHDLDLADHLTDRPGRTLLLDGVQWNGDQPAGWQLTELTDSDAVPDQLRRAILGGRRRVLYVEGEHDSIDIALYRVLYPNWRIRPAGSSTIVRRTVAAFGDEPNSHWLHVRGIVDGDERDNTERAALRRHGILALQVSEVENIYLLPAVIAAVATAVGEDQDRTAARAMTDALDGLRQPGVLRRLTADLARDLVQRRLPATLPTTWPTEPEITLTVPNPSEDLLATASALLAADDLDGLLGMVPIRETRAPGRVATALGYRSPSDYQRAARQQLRQDFDLANIVRARIGAIPD